MLAYPHWWWRFEKLIEVTETLEVVEVDDSWDDWPLGPPEE